MSVAVYPRLGELLRTNNLSVAELERQIEQRYGLSVNVKTLYRFASSEPVQRADLEIAGAVAAVLGVDLSDLFDVQVVPVGEQRDEVDMLNPIESRRLADLFDRQARGVLSRAERGELGALLDAYGERLHEVRVQECAELRNISLEEARREMAADLGRALSWWHEFARHRAHQDHIETAQEQATHTATE